VPSLITTSRAKSRSPAQRTANGSRGARDAEPVDNVTRVYNELHTLIVSGQLPPGTRIAERAVVARMGLSRTPVRSALHRLQQEGFVASVGRAGDQRLIVTPLTRGDGREVFLIVGHLEGLAARRPPRYRRPAKEIVRRLRAVNRELARRRERRRRLGVVRPRRPVSRVHRGRGGPSVVALHRAIKPQSERYARLYVNVARRVDVGQEHEAIATAIAKGDPRAAQNAVETNWRNAAVRLAEDRGGTGNAGIGCSSIRRWRRSRKSRAPRHDSVSPEEPPLSIPAGALMLT
jgi:DNA-binding GntR family transcriptional regulator